MSTDNTEISTALSSLSLSSSSPSSTSSSSTESTFFLACSDGKDVSVDVELLISSSGVFRDMLETGSGERKCEVSESSREVEVLVAAIMEGTAPDSKDEWLSLCKLKDKYDVKSLQGILDGSLRSLTITPDTPPASPPLSSPSHPSFTLFSCDGSAFSISIALLCKSSALFQDVFEGRTSDSCSLREAAQEVDLFVDALELGMIPMDEEQWWGLYEMMGKYEAPILREPLLASGRSLMHYNTSTTYAAACFLGERELAVAAAKPGLDKELRKSSLFDKLPQKDQDRLLDYRQNVVNVGLDLLACADPPPPETQVISGWLVHNKRNASDVWDECHERMYGCLKGRPWLHPVNNMWLEVESGCGG
ncbi:hypothetical protein JCM8547_003072 [Rhodosporidiobolus lusitaniae]